MVSAVEEGDEGVSPPEMNMDCADGSSRLHGEHSLRSLFRPQTDLGISWFAPKYQRVRPAHDTVCGDRSPDVPLQYEQ